VLRRSRDLHTALHAVCMCINVLWCPTLRSAQPASSLLVSQLQPQPRRHQQGVPQQPWGQGLDAAQAAGADRTAV
jgi:hypothetical protein